MIRHQDVISDAAMILLIYLSKFRKFLSVFVVFQRDFPSRALAIFKMMFHSQIEISI